MNEWENNHQEDENSDINETNEPEETRDDMQLNEEGDSQEPQDQEPEQAEQPDRPDEPETENKPYEPQPAQNANQTWAYSWNGKQQKKSGKGSRIFFVVAIICLLLCAAICIPTILYSYNHSAPYVTPADTSRDESSKAPTPAESSAESEVDESSYEVSESVKHAETKYTEQSDLIDVYNKCSESCVTVYVTFASKTSYVIGSGFVLTEDGYIATNQHVVNDGKKFKVIFYNEEEYEATLVGEDKVRDLAVLKIEKTGLRPMDIGDSDALQVGQTVIAIGTPYDTALAGTMTKGIISGVNRKVNVEDDSGRVTKTMSLIQTDTSINPGNSGGPLINMAGQVVGINVMKLINEYEGLGFAIPMNHALQIFNQLIQYGKVVNEPDNDFVATSARLGITIYDLDTGLETYRIKPKCEYPSAGALVASVEPDTAIYAAGLRTYDIITEFNGVKIEDRIDLTTELAKHKAGEKVTMKIFTFSGNFSSGEYKELSFVLDAAS